ncbi:MAG: metallophosphoesterase [Ignavibacteriaceae bacterium]|nr:metallophosphoesterase [Ignavibacteriaceae bacterium]
MNPPYKFVDCPEGRSIVVGDIHGCYSELILLLQKMDFSDKDLLISVGDLLDRGPASWEVARFFRKSSNCFSVVGNHERRVSGIIKGTSGASWSQLHSLSKLPADEYLDWSQWLDSLPAVIETPHVIVNHARLDPKVDLKSQDFVFTCAVGGEKTRIELDDNGIPLWFPAFMGRMKVYKPVCIGHITYRTVELIKNELYALDTGAVTGGSLTAVEFPSGSIVSVQAAENHYDKSFAEWIHDKRRGVIIRDIRFNSIMNGNYSGLSEAFERELDVCNFERRSAALRPLLQVMFGELPDDGNGRRDYLMRIDSLIKDPVKKAIIKTIMIKGSILNKTLLKISPVKTLNDLDKIFKEIEAEEL